jgi:hypothetical protein
MSKKAAKKAELKRRGTLTEASTKVGVLDVGLEYLST